MQALVFTSVCRPIFWLVLVAVVLFVLSALGVVFVLVCLPADYFIDNKDLRQNSLAVENKTWWFDRHPLTRMVILVLKNLLGFVLIIFGFVMLVTPGQGILTILIGIMFLNFPGKRKLEQVIISRPKVFEAVNKLRLRFRKQPLKLSNYC